MTNCIRYFPTQAFNLAFKDTIKGAFPKFNRKTQFNGLIDCLKKTAGGPGGFFSLYNGFGPSVAGIIAYRGSQFGLAQIAVTASGLVAYPFDTIRRRLQMQSDK